MATNPPQQQESTPKAPQQDRAVIQWLLDAGSDPAIRWQVLRDLTGASQEDIATERARVATEGWGARLLALQGTDGAWGGTAWNQGWDSTMHVLTLLREMGLDPASAEARRAVGLVRERVRWMGWDWDGTWRGEDFVGNPFFAGEVEPCINGQVAASGAYFGCVVDIQRIIGLLLAEQLPDGGWNCEAERGATRSSFNTTICVLEALLEYERAGGPRSAEVRAARLRGQEYLLERRLLRRKATGEVIDPAFTRLAFPSWWHYDVLRALDYLRSAGVTPDERMAEAIALVEAKRDGAGRWPLEHQYPGRMPIALDAGEGRPSRWNTLRALRVLAWYAARDERQSGDRATARTLPEGPSGAIRMMQTAKLDLFAGIPVTDYAAARPWYERLLGAPPSFLPHATEAVWELAEHRYVYIVQQPEHAGHARHTLFVADLDALVAQVAARGFEPAQRETYANGVRKITYRDPDGNEIGFGGASL